MKKIIIVLLTVIVLFSCNTQKAVLSRPSRPTLETVSESVPAGAQRNLLSLMVYSQRLEAVVDEYERMVK